MYQIFKIIIYAAAMLAMSALVFAEVAPTNVEQASKHLSEIIGNNFLKIIFFVFVLWVVLSEIFKIFKNRNKKDD